MFQTGIHIAVQSLASDSLTWLMRQVTAVGYYQTIAALVIAVMFGFSLRRGFLLFQIIVWTAIITEGAKNLFGLPRPFFADSRVALLEDGYDAASSFRAMGGAGFLDLPPREVIAAYRLQDLSFGFPSGHASGAVAMWGGLAVLFRRRALAWLAPFAVALVAFTRIYLGVHFLADVLGGVLLGGLVLLGAWRLLGSEAGRARFFAALSERLASSLPGALVFFLLFAAPLLLALFSLLAANLAGFYFGANAAFALALRRHWPTEGGSAGQRAARVALAGLIFLLSYLALGLLPAAGSPWGRFLAAALATFLSLWGGIRLCLLLGLYRPSAAGA